MPSKEYQSYIAITWILAAVWSIPYVLCQYSSSSLSLSVTFIKYGWVKKEKKSLWLFQCWIMNYKENKQTIPQNKL